jgi:hypothetical protein
MELTSMASRSGRLESVMVQAFGGAKEPFRQEVIKIIAAESDRLLGALDRHTRGVGADRAHEPAL